MVLLIENHFHQIYKRVSGYAYHQGHPSPEDAAMDAISQALSHATKFEGDLENLVSYIISITRYDLIDHRRRIITKPTANVSVYDLQDSDAPTYCDEYFKYQYLYNIKKMIKALDQAESDAIIAKYLYDMTDDEAAEFTKRSSKYLRRARSTAYKKLRRLVAH
jgi:RNA polymerase sigma factor (sigma-70 family)